MKARHIILRIVGMVALAMICLVLLASPALAIAEPTSVSLEDIEIFQDLLVEDDFLAVVPYNIAFTIPPTQNIDKTFIFRLFSADGETEEGTALATTIYDGGYGQGIVSFYFASGMNWGEAYIFRVQQNPIYYPSAQKWDFYIGDSNYSSAVDQQAALKAKIVDTANDLRDSFGVELLARTESGSTVLSSEGELYYLDAILGLQNMCPALFYIQHENPDYTKRTWDTSFAVALQTKYAGTFIEDFMTGYAGLFSMEKNTAIAFFSIIVCVILIGISVWKFKASMLSGFIDGYTLLLLLMLIGYFPMVAAGGIAFCSVVLGGVILFLNRA